MKEHSPSPSPPVYTQQPTMVVVQAPIMGNPPGDQFMMSLFTTFCCFMPLGIIALIKSVEVSVMKKTLSLCSFIQSYEQWFNLHCVCIIPKLKLQNFVPIK